MSGSLSGKTALVTGASKGIGAGIAKGLAAAGAAVLVNYATSTDDANRVVSDIVANGGQARAIRGDISDQSEVARMFSDIERHEGSLDVLVNNAGIYVATPIEGVTDEQFHRVFGTNVLGLLLVTQAAIPLFGPAGGSIVNIGALSGRMASPYMPVYAGTKGAVDAITLSLSKELGSRRIRVNSLNPGAVETDGLLNSGFLQSEMAERILASTPLGRFGHPDDIAKIAVFLASDAAFWINGQILAAAGGLTY